MKVIIIGGMAAGVSAATRLRRLYEGIEITLIESGPAIAYASRRMPYYLGRVISSRDSLLTTSVASFRKRFNVDVRINCKATAINRMAKTVTVHNADGSNEAIPYDRLLLATGSLPIRISIPGLPDDRAFTLHNLSDLDLLDAVCRVTKSAIVLGGCPMGIEIAENLVKRGLKITLVEKAGHLLPAMLDPEMAVDLPDALRAEGVDVRTGRTVASWADGIATLDDKTTAPTDFIVMALGVRPNNALAQAAGLELDPCGYIKVNEDLATSDPSIFAAGDVSDVNGSATIQGRFVAIKLLGTTYDQEIRPFRCDEDCFVKIAKVGDLTVASVGVSERTTKEKTSAIYVHPSSRAQCHPNATVLHIKVLCERNIDYIYGAQVVGSENVEWLIDSLADAIDVYEPSELQMSGNHHVPPYHSMQSPLDTLVMMLGDAASSLACAITPKDIPKDAFLLDVREPAEFAAGTIPGAINIPLGNLRNRFNEVPQDHRLIVAFSGRGKRGYFAERILIQRVREDVGVCHLSGGYTTWLAYKKAGLV